MCSEGRRGGRLYDGMAEDRWAEQDRFWDFGEWACTLSSEAEERKKGCVGVFWEQLQG